jgi:hypothetical protein
MTREMFEIRELCRPQARLGATNSDGALFSYVGFQVRRILSRYLELTASIGRLFGASCEPEHTS